MSLYKRELQNRKKNVSKEKQSLYEESGDELPGLSKSTIKRSLTALRSLFNFLSTTINDETNERLENLADREEQRQSEEENYLSAIRRAIQNDNIIG